MGRREKKLKAAKLEESSESEEESRKAQNPVEAMESDDDEANEDLSLKIVQKAMLRACNGNPEDDGVLSVVTDLKKGEKEKKKRKKSTVTELLDDDVSGEIDNGFKDFCGDLTMVDNVIGEEKVQSSKAVEISEKTAEVPDNAVLRKLLRGPRYFDPPDSSWGACYNCGEEGHTTVNCTSARRKKPCFVCGSFEHNARQCSKGRDCFICKLQGHRAKDCPEKNSSKMCLKCGDFGHDMFSCRNEYSADDLKVIQCYICHNFGHLCCADYGSPGKRVVSCYRCGGSGHTGLACTGSYGDTSGTGTSNCYRCGEGGHFARECTSSAKGGEADGSCYKCGGGGHFARECTVSKKVNYTSSAKGGEADGSCYKCGGEGHFARECTISKKVNYTSSAKGGESDGSCYKCGGEGHFARECTVSKKASKRNREPSTPKQKSSKKNRDHNKEAKSAPHDLGNTRKKKKSHSEEFSPAAVKPKHRGGWITEDPGYHYSSMPRASDNWRSPATPVDRRSRIPSYNNGDYYASSSHSYRSPYNHLDYSNSAANGPPGYYPHRFTPSRFGNSSNGGMRRNYDWW